MAENRQQQIPRCTLMYWPNSETVEPLGAVPSVASLIIGAATGPSAGGWLLGERSSAGSYRSSSHQDRLAQSLSLWMNHNRFSASHEDTWGWNFHYRALLRRIGESLCVCEYISMCVCVPALPGFLLHRWIIHRTLFILQRSTDEVLIQTIWRVVNRSSNNSEGSRGGWTR